MAEGIDWKGWDRMKARLNKLARSYPEGAEQCAAGIGTQVIHDSINEPPTVPVDTAFLRESGTFEVFGGWHWRYAKLVVGFNAYYAAKVHQVPMNFNTQRAPGAGNYFLSSKLQRHAKDYIGAWGRCVSRAVGTA